jgi:hypothetical protein
VKLDVTGVLSTPGFARICHVEGNRFWFYSLLCSILLHLLFLFSPGVPPLLPPKAVSSPDSSKRVTAKRVREIQKAQHEKEMESNLVKRRLVADCCDLLIPGLVVGWTETSLLVTGYSGAVSSALALGEIWRKLR